jgi:hypothetical protein
MRLYLCFVAIFLFTSLSSNSLSLDDDPDFIVDINKLKQGSILYFSRIYDRINFEEKGGAFRALDNLYWRHEKGQYITFAKTAFILPVNTKVFLDQQIFKRENYLRALFPRIIGVTDENSLQVHVFDDVNFLRRKTKNFHTVNQFTVFNPNTNAKQNYELFSLVKHLDKTISLPLAGIVKFEVVQSSEPAIQHAINISKYFASGSETLVISYRIAIIKPNSWIIKNILEHAPMLLLRFDREDFISGVKSASSLVAK